MWEIQASTFLAVNLLMLTLSLAIDFLLGEPPTKIHPTVWMGKLITFLEGKLKGNYSSKYEKVNGVFLALISTTLFGFLCHSILYICSHIHLFLFLVVGAFLLKSTFAVRSMWEHSTPIAKTLNNGNLPYARKLVSRIVSRNTEKLDREHLISATVESVAESIVDGFTSPLFYFSIFGVVGAFVYRVVNTLDSMVGYKSERYIRFGWFSAKLDSLANFIPARITAYLMVVAAWISGLNWKNALKVLRRDRFKTESINAGWPMSVVAGALNVQLEKLGVYILGEKGEELSVKHIYLALSIMRTTMILYVFLFIVPIMFLMEGFKVF